MCDRFDFNVTYAGIDADVSQVRGGGYVGNNAISGGAGRVCC
jgi:hypothetical protein